MKTATISILALTIAAVGCGGAEDDLFCFEDNGETICQAAFGSTSNLERAADHELASLPAAACEHCAAGLQMGTAQTADPVDQKHVVKTERDDFVRDRDDACPDGTLYNLETASCQPTAAPSDRDSASAQGTCPRGERMVRGACIPADDKRDDYPADR